MSFYLSVVVFYTRPARYTVVFSGAN